MGKWYSCYLVQCDTVSKNRPPISNILFMKHDYELAVELFFKFYKKQTKTKNLETCRDVMISYVEAVIKIWGGFTQVCHVRCLPPRRPLHEIMKLLRRFFGLQASYVTTCAKPSYFFYHSLNIWYHDILTNFMIFGLRLLFIEFKNNSTASSWSCFVNKMFEIGDLFLDTASHYTK